MRRTCAFLQRQSPLSSFSFCFVIFADKPTLLIGSICGYVCSPISINFALFMHNLHQNEVNISRNIINRFPRPVLVHQPIVIQINVR